MEFTCTLVTRLNLLDFHFSVLLPPGFVMRLTVAKSARKLLAAELLLSGTKGLQRLSCRVDEIGLPYLSKFKVTFSLVQATATYTCEL